ncbi:toxin-antitoxin system HicB family antitoxin [Ilumatobacter sp.]|uniref:toxin-antitoxin system HicB family antitoxin n=1 Tax=Ilumatobacter sp. TaxID=1967498 RepID=UPI003AF7BBEF
MQVQPVLNNVRAALAAQGSLADDPAVDEATAALVDAIGPALQMVAMEFAQQAADEVRAQLAGHAVDVLIVDGDPTLRVTETSTSSNESPAEDLDARITLRLPPSLKRLIEDAAVVDGDSVNAWVVDALAKRTKRSPGGTNRVTEGFDL